jgi:ribonucleoside-diphosphate reductase beta chain
MTVFNAQNTEWKSGEGSLFMGQSPAMHDSVNVRYPAIQNIYKRQVSQRWVEDEFNHDQSRLDLLNCPESVYKVMLMNLAYQWEADSVASRSIAPLLAPFVTNSELWAALLENTNMEVVHALTYSEIVRQCVADPSEVFKMVMENEKTIARSSTVNKVFDGLAVMGALRTLKENGVNQFAVGEQTQYNTAFMAVVALCCLERIQFMASFAATFAIVEQGYFQSIGKAVQKIMLDEIAVHAALDAEVLKVELSTERGLIARKECGKLIHMMLQEVVDQELQWSEYLFSEGRAIVGLNPALLKDWVRYNAQPVFDALGYDLDWDRITVNPLPWMQNWIDIDKTQNAMQEADGNNYALNVVKNDLGEEELDF